MLKNRHYSPAICFAYGDRFPLCWLELMVIFLPQPLECCDD